MSPRVLLWLLPLAALAASPAHAACEDLVGTRYYAPCVDQAREREAHEVEGARRQEQRLQDLERRQQTIDERTQQLEREQRLEEMRRRMGPPVLR
jgi:hypothetical protein